MQEIFIYFYDRGLASVCVEAPFGKYWSFQPLVIVGEAVQISVCGATSEWMKFIPA